MSAGFDDRQPARGDGTGGSRAAVPRPEPACFVEMNSATTQPATASSARQVSIFTPIRLLLCAAYRKTAAATTLDPATLWPGDGALALMTPWPPSYAASPESLTGDTGQIFDALRPVEDAAALTMNEILQPERAARLAQATSDLASSDQITASPPIRPGTPEILCSRPVWVVARFVKNRPLAAHAHDAYLWQRLSDVLTGRAGSPARQNNRCGFERGASSAGRTLRCAGAPRPPAARPQ